MNNMHLYSLLNVIHTNGDVRKLKRDGLDYEKIALLTKRAITDSLVIFEDNNITLSSLGRDKLNELSNEYKLTNKDMWIDAENESRIPKIGTDSIYLPNQNELFLT